MIPGKKHEEAIPGQRRWILLQGEWSTCSDSVENAAMSVDLRGNLTKDSREGAKTRRNPEELSAIVVDCAYHLHVEAGPALLESVYAVVLARMLENRGPCFSEKLGIAHQLRSRHLQGRHSAHRSSPSRLRGFAPSREPKWPRNKTVKTPNATAPGTK